MNSPKLVGGEREYSYHAHSELMAQLVRRHVASGIQGNSADISTQYYKIKALKYRDIRNYLRLRDMWPSLIALLSQ